MQKWRASITSKGWKVSFKSAFKKREKKAKYGMAEEKMGGEREELPQEEKNVEKTRGPELQKMPEEGGENEKVHWPQTKNGSRPTKRVVMG